MPDLTPRFPLVFILSPARLDGARARLLFRPATMFPAAAALQSPEGATLGDVFSFVSGLYFRAKLAYAEAFARPPETMAGGALVITTTRGLLPPSTRINLEDLATFAAAPIEGAPAFREALEHDAQDLAAELGSRGTAVLLGSVATGKYVDVLERVFGERLLFPAELVGRGDMSRGGLMLRCIDAGRELTYEPVRGAVRRGVRPPKLAARAKTGRNPP